MRTILTLACALLVLTGCTSKPEQPVAFETSDDIQAIDIKVPAHLRGIDVEHQAVIYWQQWKKDHPDQETVSSPKFYDRNGEDHYVFLVMKKK